MLSAPTTSKLTSKWDSARHGTGGWPKFLSSVKVTGLRGWTGEHVDFRYPVVAIAGVNGAGKSTILKAVAAAYRAPEGGDAVTYSADDFFPNTPWEVVQGVVLAYVIQQGDRTENVTLRKPTSRWRGGPERKVRPSYFLDISRVQPANTQIGYGRTAQEVISRGETENISEEQVLQLNRTLGRTYEKASFARSNDKQIGVLAQAGIEYSNFHQGAGEDSALDLLSLVNSAPVNSLIVIDEVEASLHPTAQRGLMTELIRLAHDKRLQIVLSTHSPFILEQLPSIARVFISMDRDTRRQVLYGVSAQFALNLMDDIAHEELDIYCEDERAGYLIERILATGASDTLPRIRITPVGPANAVRLLSGIAQARKLPRDALCVLDAGEGPGEHTLVLPGSAAPEREVLESLGATEWNAVAERLGRGVEEVLDAKDRALAIPDHHAWPAEIARLVSGALRPEKIWEAASDVWVRDVLGEDRAKTWSQQVVDRLDMSSNAQ